MFSFSYGKSLIGAVLILAGILGYQWLSGQNDQVLAQYSQAQLNEGLQRASQGHYDAIAPDSQAFFQQTLHEALTASPMTSRNLPIVQRRFVLMLRQAFNQTELGNMNDEQLWQWLYQQGAFGFFQRPGLSVKTKFDNGLIAVGDLYQNEQLLWSNLMFQSDGTGWDLSLQGFFEVLGEEWQNQADAAGLALNDWLIKGMNIQAEDPWSVRP